MHKTNQLYPLFAVYMMGITVLIFIVLMSSCEKRQNTQTQHQKIKNVILMIGDGMGPQQVGQAMMYRTLATPESDPLALEVLNKKAVIGTSNTYSLGNLVTDSAAAATAMACGVKTLNDTVGLNPDGTPCESILIKAHKMGKSTGLVSNTRLSHATPAGFVAHNISREEENEIAAEIIDLNLVDVLLDGGARHLLPGTTLLSTIEECRGIDKKIDGLGKRLDNRNLIADAKKSGYRFVCTRDQLDDIASGDTPKLLGLFANSVFPYVVDRDVKSSLPTLTQMTLAALKVLHNDPDGFFLMVEGGEIDFAGHENDAATMLKETLDFDDALNAAINFVDKNPDTLLIVTADHETGSFGFSYHQHLTGDTLAVKNFPGNKVYQPRYTAAPVDKVFDLLHRQKISFFALLSPFLDQIYAQGRAPETLISAFRTELTKHTAYTLTDKEILYVLSKESPFAVIGQSKFIFSSEGELSEIHCNKLAKMVSPQNYAVWGTGTHTSVPVPIYVYGNHEIAQSFAGNIQNTDIPQIIEEQWQAKVLAAE